MYYIYKITNTKTGLCYIGLTNNIARRRARLFTDLRCNRHDNQFLQKAFNIDGEENFTFEVLFSGDVTEQEIGDKEKEYIKLYDSYHNGYNQNEGGNFGSSNGGSQLTQSDIFNILSALEFKSRPGAVLSRIYGVSVKTISRIKNGENHSQYKEAYYKLPLEARQAIYDTFNESCNFDEQKAFSTVLTSKRKLSEHQVHLILCNEEQPKRIIPLKKFARLLGFASDYSLRSIIEGNSYKDYHITYKRLTDVQKEQLVQLLRNEEIN